MPEFTLTKPASIAIPRARHALAMGGATLLALGAALGIGSVYGGVAAGKVAALALLIGSVATFIPVVIHFSSQSWGIAVLGSGVVRTIVMLVVCSMATNQNQDLSSRAVYMGAAVGALILLFAETASSLSILSGIERQRDAAKHARSDLVSTHVEAPTGQTVEAHLGMD